MKRFSIVLVLAVVLLLGTSVLAQNIPVSKDISDFVKDVAIKKGISEDQITNVEQVDMNNLPEEITIENIDETNLAMYKLDVEDLNGTKPVYVITASKEKFEKEVKKFASKMLLNFGFSGKMNTSTFLLSGTGVQGSYDKGYVMLRDGSVTGLSTNLDIKNSFPDGVAEIILYKNGETIGFRNTINLKESGSKLDYDLINEGTINFQKGDIISAKVLLSDGVQVSDVNTLLEITTEA